MEFINYLKLGFWHITDLNGIDHLLFIVALASVYVLKDWKELVILVTAFTVGHSVTLALATLGLVEVDSAIIEFLIPVTIVFTCFYNFSYKFKRKTYARHVGNSLWPRYLMALLFGFIHGLGFSNYLRSLLGKESSLFQPLLAFNIGLEVGQLLIVLGFLLVAFLVLDILGRNRSKWNLIISGIVCGIALTMVMEKWPWS